MPRMAMLAGLAAGMAVALPAASAAAAGSPDAPRATVYDVGATARTLLAGPGGFECKADNVHRQAPGDGSALCSDDDRDLAHVSESRDWDGETTHNFGLHRALSKIDGRGLARLATAQSMAARIRSEIDSPSAQTTSGEVGIDEIGNAFRDPKTPVSKRAFYCNGKKLGVFPTAHSVRCSVRGWKLVKSRIQPAPPAPGSPAADLAGAMQILADTEHPAGGSYADRVHLYMAPAVVTSIAAGRGQHFTQGRSGTKPIRRGWQGVGRAMALAGGVHVEMYHRPGSPVTSRVWRLGPPRIARYVSRFGGNPNRIHLIFTNAATAPAGSNCASSEPMACQVELARRGPNARLLDNGPTLYRLGDQADDFLAAYRAPARR